MVAYFLCPTSWARHPLLRYSQSRPSGVLRPRPRPSVAHRHSARPKRPHTKLSWLPHPGRPPSLVARCSLPSAPHSHGAGRGCSAAAPPRQLSWSSAPRARSHRLQLPVPAPEPTGYYRATVSVGGVVAARRVHPPSNSVPNLQSLSSLADHPSSGRRPIPQFPTWSPGGRPCGRNGNGDGPRRDRHVPDEGPLFFSPLAYPPTSIYEDVSYADRTRAGCRRYHELRRAPARLWRRCGSRAPSFLPPLPRRGDVASETPPGRSGEATAAGDSTGTGEVRGRGNASLVKMTELTPSEVAHCAARQFTQLPRLRFPTATTTLAARSTLDMCAPCSVRFVLSTSPAHACAVAVMPRHRDRIAGQVWEGCSGHRTARYWWW